MTSFKLSLGAAYSRTGDRESAQKVYEELTDTPFAADAYRNLGSLYSDEGHLDKAILSLERAVQLRSTFPDAYQDLGVVYLRKQMPDAAIRQFRTTLEQQADHGPATINLAVAENMKGDTRGAKQTLQNYIERYGTTNSPYIGQARQRLAAMK
jgi:tetratricopeptide (TPR) repeat protein